MRNVFVKVDGEEYSWSGEQYYWDIDDGLVLVVYDELGSPVGAYSKWDKVQGTHFSKWDEG